MVLFKTTFFCFFIWLFFSQSATGQNTLSNAQADIIISEIMADPDPSFGLPSEEYAELYNRGNIPADLTGWVFYDGSNHTMPPVILMPGQHLIVCSKSDTALFQAYGITAGLSSFSLTNSGEKLAIYDLSGSASDSVIYSNDWYGSSFKKDGGWSLERVDYEYSCANPSNWKPSTAGSGGTPGLLNSVAGTFIDEITPVVIRVYCPDSFSVIILFSEAIDPATVSLLQMQFTGNLIPSGTPLLFQPDRLLVTFTFQLAINTQYRIWLSGVSDCSGNFIASPASAFFGISDSTNEPGWVINEVLFDPYPEGSDFVEVINKSDLPEDLRYYKIASLDPVTYEPKTVYDITSEPYVLFPGELAVLTESVSGITEFYNSSYPYNFLQVDDLPSMNNDEGVTAIVKLGKIADYFHYKENYHFELLQNTEGVSLERISPFRRSEDVSNWHSASSFAGYATPGIMNSVSTGETDQGDMASAIPEIFSPDQDGYDDVITFSISKESAGYVSRIRIINLEGQVVFEPDGGFLSGIYNSYTWDGVDNHGEIPSPGIYVALIETYNLVGRVKSYKIPFVLAVRL